MRRTDKLAAPPSSWLARARAALLLLAVVGVGAPPARADDDPGAGDWGSGHEYRALGVHPEVSGAWGYARERWEADGAMTDGAWVYVMRREGQTEMAYRVDATVGEGGTAHLIVQAIDSDGSVIYEPVHVGGAEVETGGDREAAVRALVQAADAAAADWAEAAAATAPEGKEPLDTERLRWRAVARALETAHDEHPSHLGIWRDLVVAYSRLLPLTAETPTASTLAVLLPRTIAAWQAAWEHRTTGDNILIARRAYAGLYLQTGPHAMAAEASVDGASDPELAHVLEVLKSLGYESFDRLDNFEVEGGLATCLVAGWHANGKPSVAGASFERLAFRVAPKGGSAAFDVAYVLSGRLAPDGSGAVRWALYGVVGASRRLLRLYGTEEPDGVLVRNFVRSHIERSLEAAKPAGGPK